MQINLAEVLWLLVLAFVMVGVPALVLKLVTIWFVRADSHRRRFHLFGLSIMGSALAGAVSIVCYTILSHLLEFPAPGGQFVPRTAVFLATVAILIGLVSASDGLLWRRFARRNSAQPWDAGPVWLIAGNAWILWATWLMDQYRAVQQFNINNGD